jgi:hypothetical protein
LILSWFCTFLLLLASVCNDCAGANLPNVQDATSIIKTVREWIDNDLQIKSEETKSLLPDNSSVCIILRHHGEVIGVGTSSVKNVNPIAQSAQHAFDDLKHHEILRRLTPEFKSHALASLSIELEIGSTPEPSPSKSLEKFSYSVNKGIDGIAVRKGSNWAIRLPAELRLVPDSNITTSLEALCVEVGVHPATALSRMLPKKEDVTLYKVPTITFTQTGTGKKISQLFRGDKLVNQKDITSENLKNLANLLASHLMACTNDDGLVIGGYQPETDSLSPPHSTAFVQVLVATSLESYSSICTTANISKSNNAIDSILSNIVGNFEKTKNLSDGVAASLVVLAANNAGLDQKFPNLFNYCRSQVVESCKQIVTDEVLDEKPHIFSLLTSAIVSISNNSENESTKLLAEKMCYTCVTRIPLSNMVSTIPWLIDAISENSNDGLESDIAQKLFSICVVSQVTEGNDPDHLGGFELMSNNINSVDARCIRMLPMLARFAETPNPNQSRAILSLTKALRYLTQITTTEQRANTFSNPKLAIGGVRAATWDASMPTEATAMALLGATKAIQAFDVASKTR